MNDYKRNIPLLYIYSIFIKRVSMPIIILYFLLNNLSYTEIGILASVTAAITLITEIHGGIFADIHGRKSSLILHAFFGLITMFFYYVGNSFIYFLIASISYGLAGAFITGTKNSFLYDTLRKLGMTEDFKKYNGRSVLYSHLVNAVVLLFIPVIYNVNVKLPFLIGMAFFVVAIITAFLFKEPVNKLTEKNYNKRLFNSLQEVISHKLLLSSIILTTILFAFIYMASDYIQPLLRISGLQIVYFGIVFALMRVIMGFAADIAHRFKARIEYLLLAGISIVLVSFLGFHLGKTIILMTAAILLLKFGEGFNRILLENEINSAIKSDNRTAILSISSLSRSLLLALIAVPFGALADFVGVQQMFLYAFIILAILSTAAYFFLQENLEIVTV